ncbi:MAG: complex I subunit 1/NuoH family protein [Planctomycetota bacterium]
MILTLYALFLPVIIFQFVPILGWIERKASALIQNRVGPNKAKIFGFTLGGFPHLMADAIKFLTKENFVPKNTSYFLYTLAPLLKVLPLFFPFIFIPYIIPFAYDNKLYSLTIFKSQYSILYIIIFLEIAIYGIFLAGFTSKSKYSMLGSLRAAAGMLSFEIGFAFLILSLSLYFNTFDIEEITKAQEHTLLGLIPQWGIVINPLGFFLFLIVGFIETHRLPFDIPEGESEIVDGFRTEYSGVRFILFLAAEYIGILLMSALITTLYFGGGSIGFINTSTLNKIFNPAITAIITFIVFWVKTLLWCLFFIWTRWTLPRFRYDQLLDFGWKIILPLSFLNFITTILLKKDIYRL